MKLSSIEPRDVREMLMAMRNEGKSTSMIRKTRASLSTLFATPLEDGLINSNPIRGVRIPAPLVEEVPDDERVRALTRSELATPRSAIPEDWHLFFEFLVHTGLRISEAIGLAWEHLELKARALVGMPWVSFHSFRHACASLLFANGKDIKQIQTWLGHADAGFTLRTYVDPEDGVGSADFLDDAVEVGRGPWSEDPEGS